MWIGRVAVRFHFVRILERGLHSDRRDEFALRYPVRPGTRDDLKQTDAIDEEDDPPSEVDLDDANVFELFDAKGELRAIAGGGRYDKLVGLFSKEEVPATGVSFGLDERAKPAVYPLIAFSHGQHYGRPLIPPHG